MGYRLGGWIASRIASQSQMPLVQAIYANQWVVSNGTLLPAQMKSVVKECLTYVARAYYELFHYWGDAAAMQQRVVFTPQIEEVIDRSRQGRCGTVVAGLHMSGFDLVSQAAAYHGLRGVALSLPEANQAVEWQHEFRRQAGLEILPATLGNIRQVIHRLQGGATVLTGIDRPMPGLKYRPLFFGRPAMVPTQHVYLALKAQVPLILMGCILDADGCYHILTSDYMEMRAFDDRHREMLYNAEMILERAVEIVRQAPYQWAVNYPVWPETAAEIFC